MLSIKQSETRGKKFDLNTALDIVMEKVQKQGATLRVNEQTYSTLLCIPPLYICKHCFKYAGVECRKV